jgi:hypothetical protein
MYNIFQKQKQKSSGVKSWGGAKVGTHSNSMTPLQLLLFLREPLPPSQKKHKKCALRREHHERALNMYTYSRTTRNVPLQSRLVNSHSDIFDPWGVE